MLDHRLFADRKRAADDFNGEVHACARRFKGVECEGAFTKTKRRKIRFLDTRDGTIAMNRLLLRQREDLDAKVTEYTLKCRSPDRYVASGARVQAANAAKQEEKLEEDVGAPFVCRFSHSSTIRGRKKPPAILAEGAELFPVLAKLERDGQRCASDLELEAVNALTAFERVVKGPMLQFDKVEAEVALILWSDGPDGRSLVSEFSFRYGHKKEGFEPKAARLAMHFFEEIQRLDWCLPEGRTKTQYVYRET